MRVEKHTKIIPERKEVTVTYIGNCPECGCQQESHFSTSVDKICMACRQKKEQEDRKRFLDTYIGAEILKIENESTIIIKTKDKKVYELWFWRDDDGAAELEIEEIHEGDASWFKL